jgi:hypothetical protein
VVEAGVCVDVEVLRVGVMLAESKTRPEEDQSSPPTVECPRVEEEGGLSGEGIDGYGSDTRRGSRWSGRRDARDRCGGHGG